MSRQNRPMVPRADRFPSGRVKMAEGGREAKGGVFAKSIKRATRAKERFLQSIGKAEKSEKDETFQDYVGNFNNQQAAAVKLQKELKNYANSVKAMSLASKNLNDALTEAYGDDWPDKDEVRNSQDSMDLLWSDYQEKVTREVLSPVNTYQSQFPEVKQRIAKRGRKLVDYDAARHTLATAQQSKKRDDAKLQKAQDECQKAKKVYDDVNNGLMDELPALHDSRIGFYVSTFQALFSSEQRFHTDMSQLKSRLGDTLEKLQQEANTGKFATKRLPRSPGPSSPSMAEVVEAAIKKPSLQNDTDHPYESVDLHAGMKNGEVDVNVGKPKLPSGEIEGPSAKDVPDAEVEATVDPGKVDLEADVTPNIADGSDRIPSPTENDKPSAPDDILYSVITTHSYTRCDSDELSFETGETIYIIPFEDPDDADEGWLMGVKVSDSSKGLLPENHTKRLQT
ncbi:myc box-dependent-interacting protein 1-like isoform X2 [Branchiostoma floridae]|uniref:Myc box-dependent-interacting protein 1-like isoform X2 n=1 Tax=Branchiostoma floridae TaxID=7739 RepID=A0A9J7KGZ0_BRAFL|nr:myc box-dependent-interacting protein 1-like isoform X2 [Branchiostoma floridae]